MHIIHRIIALGLLTASIVGCTTGGKWGTDTADTPVTAPAALQYGSFSAGMYGTSDAHKIAVLLPTSGANESVGLSLLPGIEAAFMQFAPQGVEMNFYDTGTGDVSGVINQALASDPEIIIGPVFAENAKILRNTKPGGIPALSFTSDISALGDGVFSMSLMPSNTIESIVKQMQTNGAKKFIVLAPNDTSGQTMAGAAQSISGMYNVENIGVFFYGPHDTESIKTAAMSAALYTPRHAANIRAKEILSAILNTEELTPTERYSMARQLEKINRTDTLGQLPYDSILFLGNSDDTKSLASFLRYYGLGTREATLYGTPMWADGDIATDITMTGAEFANLAPVSDEFDAIYKTATGEPASRMAAMGYEATILAIGALYAQNGMASYLLSPGGYSGVNGVFRLRANGSNERALETVKLNGDGTATVIQNAATTFMTPIYKTNLNYIYPAEEMPISISGINPMDYIKIPERFRSKYRAKNYGATRSENHTEFPSVTVLPNDTNDFSITASDYQPVPLENVSRTYIDSVEVSE